MPIKKTKLGGKTKEKSPKSPFLFKLEVRVNDLVYKGEAKSLDVALSDFVKSPNYPFAVKTPVVIRFSDGKSEKQIVWPTMMARRKFKLLTLKPSIVELLGNKLASDLING